MATWTAWDNLSHIFQNRVYNYVQGLHKNLTILVMVKAKYPIPSTLQCLYSGDVGYVTWRSLLYACPICMNALPV